MAVARVVLLLVAFQAALTAASFLAVAPHNHKRGGKRGHFSVAKCQAKKQEQQRLANPATSNSTLKKFDDLEAQAHKVSWHKKKQAHQLPAWVQPKVQKARAARNANKTKAAPIHQSQCGMRIPFKETGFKKSSKLMALLSSSAKRSGPVFEVTVGPCTVDGDGCLMSPNYGSGNYDNAADYYSSGADSVPGFCSVTVNGAAQPLTISEFYTEGGFDMLTVNGVEYSGRGVENAPDGVVPAGIITFQADGCCTEPGFKICSTPPEAGEHEGANSFAKPGVGAKQVTADEGLSTHGTVNGQEPFVKVLKDGYFEVGCYYDSMLEFGDKFGDDKDKYGSVASHANVSIAKYSELVLKEKQEAMTPLVCFQFCRTLPGMVFFGISNGDECYCEPYYKPQAGDDASCDSPCAGDPTLMCGSSKGKSTVWEMHLCADTAADLEVSTTAAEEALTYFHESAGLAVELAEKMTEAGDALEEVAGLSGSPDSADFGMAAKKSGGELAKAFMPGRRDYEILLAAAKDAVGLEGEDFTVASNTAAAENAIVIIKDSEPKVFKAASEIRDMVLGVYPGADNEAFGATPVEDSLVKQLRQGAEAKDFRLASYAAGEKDLEPQAVICTGKTIGMPMLGLGLNGCGIACEQTLYPEKCVAYNHYQVDGTTDLCFLFSEVENVETFEKPASAAALVQQEQLRKGSKAKAGKPAAATCRVKMSEIATGFMPKGGLKKNNRCFGDCGGFEAREGNAHYHVPDTVTVNGKEVIAKLA